MPFSLALYDKAVFGFVLLVFFQSGQFHMGGFEKKKVGNIVRSSLVCS